MNRGMLSLAGWKSERWSLSVLTQTRQPRHAYGRGIFGASPNQSIAADRPLRRPLLNPRFTFVLVPESPPFFQKANERPNSENWRSPGYSTVFRRKIFVPRTPPVFSE
jgi:hypothetical protein